MERPLHGPGRRVRDCSAAALHAACLIIVAASLSLPAACAAPAAPAGTPDAIQQWSAQWHDLRVQHGHFEGAAWNDAVDRWGGAKHQALSALAQHVLAQRASPEQVTTWLGTPDRIGTRGDAEAGGRIRWQGSAAGVSVWWYRWRGTHDQLAVALGPDGRVVGTGWLYALE